MPRWVLHVMLVLALATPVAVTAAAPAYAGVAPPGSCTFENAGASGGGVAAPVSGVGQVWQLGAGFGQSFGPPGTCLFTITGTFRLAAVAWPNPTLPSIASPCVPNEFGPPTGPLQVQCTALGIVNIPPGAEGLFEFDGTITALNDGVSMTVGCQADINQFGALCWLTPLGQLIAL
jgi:hypothetical protein